ncbi:unnamed protein product [Durusdinium trenchii]|uniref:EF-hand domain-containing protein n=2 Tax=Durusdinium trenchii TaxID=1381693 RepID=A0ABP0P7S6_9DINO
MVQKTTRNMEPHLPGIPDKHSMEDEDNPGDGKPQEGKEELPCKLKTLDTSEDSPSALKAWLSEEFQRHIAALREHLDEAFDKQLQSQRSALEKLAFAVNGERDLRLAGLCFPPPRLPMAPSTEDPPAKLEVPGEKPVDSANAPATKTPADTVEGGPASSKTSSGSSCIQSQGNEEKDPERRPSRMQEAWKKSQESEKPRRASQMLGTTYSKLVTRVEIDIKESVVDAIVSVLVVLYTFILLLQTHWRGLEAVQRLDDVLPDDPNFQDWPGAETAFFVVDHIFNAIFVLEIAWRLYMHKLQFLCDIFGVFDVLVVIATSIDVYVLQPFDAGYAQNFAVGRLTRIFRLMRIFRVLRVMRFAKNLQQLRLLGDVLSKCLSPLMWALLVLGIIMVGTGVLMSQLLVEYVLDDTQPLAERRWVYDYYGTALKATYSVFEATFSGSWPLIARPLITNVSEWYCVFWIAYQVVIGFAVMRVIGALFLNETIRAANSDGEAEVLRKMKEKEAFSQKVYQFFTAADASGDGRLSYEELEAALQEPGVEAWLKALELEIHEAYTLFMLLDDDQDGEVSYEEFLHSALRLKGNARAIDSIMIMHEQAKMVTEFKRLNDMLTTEMDASREIMQRLQHRQIQPSHERRGSPFGDLLLSPAATKARLARRASEAPVRRPSHLE